MRHRLSVRGMMGWVAIVGVAAAAFRVHPVLGWFVFCVLGLAALRTPIAIDRFRADGATIRPWIAAWVFLSSTLVASVIFLTSLLYVILIASVLYSMFQYVDHPSILDALVFLVPSALLAIPIISRLRRWWW